MSIVYCEHCSETTDTDFDDGKFREDTTYQCRNCMEKELEDSK